MSTIRETAERIVRETILVVPGKIADRYIAAIEQALRDERGVAFDQGYVCAVANIMNLYGEETVAREVLNANRPKDWSIINPLDRKALQPIFDHEAAQAEIRRLRLSHDSKAL